MFSSVTSVRGLCAFVLLLGACQSTPRLPDFSARDAGASADAEEMSSVDASLIVSPDASRDAAPPDSGTADVGAVDGGEVFPDASSAPPDSGSAADPFAPRPDTSEGLTNVSADLRALLENGALTGACDAYAADPQDRRKKLLCGKAMFFYEGFATPGAPAALYDFFGRNFENELGRGFSRLGMIPDPFIPEGRSLGVAAGAPLGTVPTLAYTCASCHFGRLPDGRYAVGAPNHDYAYGQQILTVTLVPTLMTPGADRSQQHPAALAAVQPVLDVLDNNRLLRLRLLFDLLPLLGAAGSAPRLMPEQQGWYASWQPGTMDFLVAPLPSDDGIHTVSKIIDLWDIPTRAERAAARMPSAYLGWGGVTGSVLHFLEGFVRIGGGDVASWPADRLSPLEEYIFSLRSPENPTPAESASVTRGRQLFFDEGCVGCHGGPAGSGLRTYGFDEVGTDDRMKRWADPDLVGVPCCGLQGPDLMAVTHQIKSPRLTGLWAKSKLLHNGAVESLDALLCLSPRAGITEPGFSDVGHAFGCSLAVPDREALRDFLLSE